jgi:hypothetical protein
MLSLFDGPMTQMHDVFMESWWLADIRGFRAKCDICALTLCAGGEQGQRLGESLGRGAITEAASRRRIKLVC